MPAASTAHPTDAAIRAFVLGKLPDAEEAAVEQHLAACSACLTRAAAARPDDTLLSLVAAVGTRVDGGRTAARGADPTPAEFPLTREWDGRAAGPDGCDARPPEGLLRHPRYRPVRPLGQGGMGVVWLAEHTVMHRTVALKLIHPSLLGRPGAVERFRREVRAVARLSHPNIVPAHDADEAGGVHFLVMEYVPGKTLLEAVRWGPLPAAEACRAVRDAARGLAAAHAAGLVHRDVKPGNLIRAADGTVKVLDFGLVGAAAGGTGLTGENMTMGTPDYIAPEQADDPTAADARSDVYALGCTLYHLLAGRVPYPGDSALKKLDAHRDPAARPAAIPGLPPGLAAVVAKMTATDPAGRYPSADAVADALAPYCEGAAAWANPHPRRRARVAVAAAGLVLAAVAAGVVYTVHRENTVVTVETDDPDVEVVMRRNGELVRVVDTKTKQTWELDTKTMRLTPDGGELSLDLPDGAAVVLRRNGAATATIRRAPAAVPAAAPPPPAAAIREVRLFPGVTESVACVAFSPDGKYLAAGGGHRWGPLFTGYKPGSDFAVRVWNTATGAVVTTLRGHVDHVTCVTFSRDGTAIATSAGDGTARVWDAATGAERAVVRQRDPIPGVSFTPDGRGIFVTGWGQGRPRLHDAATGREVADFRPDVPAGDWQASAFAPDGRTVAAAVWGEVVVIDATSGKRVGGLAPLFRVVTVAYSADGRRVLTVDRPDTSFASSRVRVWDPAGGKELAAYPGAAGALANPAGTRLLVAGVADHRLRLYEAGRWEPLAEGTGHASTVTSVAVTRDGRYAATGGLDNTVRLWELPPPGGP